MKVSTSVNLGVLCDFDDKGVDPTQKKETGTCFWSQALDPGTQLGQAYRTTWSHLSMDGELQRAPSRAGYVRWQARLGPYRHAAQPGFGYCSLGQLVYFPMMNIILDLSEKCSEQEKARVNIKMEWSQYRSLRHSLMTRDENKTYQRWQNTSNQTGKSRSKKTMYH